MIGLDFQGAIVLAAYEPVDALNLGAVMKMALSEVRAPFIKAGLAVGALAMVMIGLGTTLFFQVSGPMLDRIRAGERRFRDLFDNINSGVAVLQAVNDGSDFIIGDFNRAAERIDGVAREVVVGRLLTDAFPGVESCGLLETIRRVHASGQSERISDVFYRDERVSGWREHKIYRLPAGDVVTLYDDITQRKATEEHLREAQRLELLGQLTGGVAHDFNNLLAIIIGNLQLLAERDGTEAEARELIADALWSAERGGELTHRLLAFARRQPLDPRVTDVNALVRGMTGWVRRTLDSRIEMRAELAAGLWPTLIDRGQLEAALMNLIIKRARCYAGRRSVDRGNAQRGYRPRAGEGRARSRTVKRYHTRQLRGGGRRRYGNRHAGEPHRPDFRAVLYDQGARQGFGTGPQHGIRIRQAVRRPCACREPSRPGDDCGTLSPQDRCQAGHRRSRERRHSSPVLRRVLIGVA